MNRDRLVCELDRAAFRCTGCGTCCRGPDNEVIVSPDEIRMIMKTTGLEMDEVVEPYPEWFEENGERFTFSWILKRKPCGSCRFLDENNRCGIYDVRPDLCRTYPFMLDGDKLLISECPALGTGKTRNPEQIADDLILRREHDDRELAGAREAYQKHSIVSGATFVIDSCGVHPWKK